MARTTISLPDELQARMKATDKPVNWSRVAAQAFNYKLAGDGTEMHLTIPLTVEQALCIIKQLSTLIESVLPETLPREP